MNLLLSLFTACCMAGGVSSADVAETKDKPYAVENFRQYTKDLMKSYEAKKATKYDNFDDQFIILMSKGFPNIQAAVQKTSAKSLDFDSPASIAEFDQQQEKLAQKMTKKSSFAHWFKKEKKNKEDIARESEIYTKKYMVFHAFAKEGYYSFFKQKLKVNGSASVCISIDRERLGIRGRKAVLIPYEKKQKAIEKQLEKLLKSMPSDSHTKHNYRIKSAKFDCDVKMDITEAGLDYLYQNPTVASIINSDIAEATPLVINLN